MTGLHLLAVILELIVWAAVVFFLIWLVRQMVGDWAADRRAIRRERRYGKME